MPDLRLLQDIENAMFYIGLSEKQTLQVLYAKGWEITNWRLKQIRLDSERRWLCRIDDPAYCLACLEVAEKAIF